jgi:hypothetical protein
MKTNQTKRIEVIGIETESLINLSHLNIMRYIDILSVV